MSASAASWSQYSVTEVALMLALMIVAPASVTRSSRVPDPIRVVQRVERTPSREHDVEVRLRRDLVDHRPQLVEREAERHPAVAELDRPAQRASGAAADPHRHPLLHGVRLDDEAVERVVRAG